MKYLCSFRGCDISFSKGKGPKSVETAKIQWSTKYYAMSTKVVSHFEKLISAPYLDGHSKKSYKCWHCSFSTCCKAQEEEMYTPPIFLFKEEQ